MIIIKSDSVPPVMLMWTDETRFLAEAVDATLHDFALHALITSGIEGTHRRASKHYKAEALDFRIVWSPVQRDGVLRALGGRLGPRGRYILESDHLHTETV